MTFQPNPDQFSDPQDTYDTLRVLTKTREILEDPASWTTCSYARDVNGKGIEQSGNDWSRAHSLCYKGAIFAAAHALGLGPEPSHAASMDQYHNGAVNALYYALPVADRTTGVRAQSLIAFNDTPDRTHSEIIACLDAAISATETQLAAMVVPA